MVDNTNNTGINTVILGPNGVDIVFTSVTLDFRTFLQFGPLMHRHGNTYYDYKCLFCSNIEQIYPIKEPWSIRCHLKLIIYSKYVLNMTNIKKINIAKW